MIKYRGESGLNQDPSEESKVNRAILNQATTCLTNQEKWKLTNQHLTEKDVPRQRKINCTKLYEKDCIWRKIENEHQILFLICHRNVFFIIVLYLINMSAIKKLLLF